VFSSAVHNAHVLHSAHIYCILLKCAFQKMTRNLLWPTLVLAMMRGDWDTILLCWEAAIDFDHFWLPSVQLYIIVHEPCKAKNEMFKNKLFFSIWRYKFNKHKLHLKFVKSVQKDTFTNETLMWQTKKELNISFTISYSIILRSYKLDIWKRSNNYS